MQEAAASSLSRHEAGKGRTVVIVSPYFPPSSLAGVHRARHLVKHLPGHGWTPIVLCVDPAHHEERLDPGLEALLPPGIEVLKAGALSARLTRTFGIGDIGLRSLVSLHRALLHLLSTRHVDAVLVTGSPFYPMLLAEGIKRRFNIPIVLDFQDPWISAWGALQPIMSKAGLTHRLSLLLEPRAVHAADFITSVSATQNAEMVTRYPWFDAERMAAIPIGGDPDDFIAARNLPTGPELLDDKADCFHLSYVGTALPRSGTLFCTLFRGFARLRVMQPRLAACIRLNFIGTSNQPNDVSSYRVRPIAEAEGVADAVREVPQRLPYLHALNWLSRSRGLLLIGSDEPHYTASKIYPALMSGRPYLSLFHRASSAHAILTAAGGGRPLAFASREELAALEEPIAAALQNLARRPEAFGAADTAAYEDYGAEAIARRFGSIFDRLASERTGPGQAN
jgi:glycosyltransferase involved in cell wall biosynthesis